MRATSDLIRYPTKEIIKVELNPNFIKEHLQNHYISELIYSSFRFIMKSFINKYRRGMKKDIQAQGN